MVSLKAILIVVWMTAGGSVDHIEYESMKACTVAKEVLLNAAKAAVVTGHIIAVCTKADDEAP